MKTPCPFESLDGLLEKAQKQAKQRSCVVRLIYHGLSILVDEDSNLKNIERRILHNLFCKQAPSSIGPNVGPITGKELENERYTALNRKISLKRLCLGGSY